MQVPDNAVNPPKGNQPYWGSGRPIRHHVSSDRVVIRHDKACSNLQSDNEGEYSSRKRCNIEFSRSSNSFVSLLENTTKRRRSSRNTSFVQQRDPIYHSASTVPSSSAGEPLSSRSTICINPVSSAASMLNDVPTRSKCLPARDSIPAGLNTSTVNSFVTHIESSAKRGRLSARRQDHTYTTLRPPPPPPGGPPPRMMKYHIFSPRLLRY